ncbi:hypothetical protein RLT57_22135 [Streptomyces sp. ITFR-21]|nr:hypothetical protein [Streptomyces sp. ITFR-21]WNI19783.1 hypothetical protein RLT57_22135 [Streptomyces sp. ITFR-21]
MVLGLLLGAAPAGAAPAGPGERVADALRTSPVYVDPAYAGAVPAARRQEVAARIARTGLPVKVALVPLVKGDAFDGDSSVLASVVHDRLGLHDLILITMDQSTDMLDGYEWPDDRHQARYAVWAVGFLDQTRNAGIADRVDKAIDLIAAGDGARVYKEATADLGGTASRAAKRGGGSGGGAALPVSLGAAAAVAVLGGLLLVRRRREAKRTGPYAFPQAVFAAGRAADEAGLRRRAEAEVIALGEAAEAAAPRPGLSRALDAYAAAGKVLDGARGIPDLAGVLVLVAEGRDALDGNTGALPLCFFDPLHGRAVHRTAWRPLGRREALDVAVCRDCERSLRAHRAPEVLTDRTADGRLVPYFELPARESVWAATGYGSLIPDEPGPTGTGDDAGGGSPDGLAARVLRGDFARTRQPHRP